MRTCSAFVLAAAVLAGATLAWAAPPDARPLIGAWGYDLTSGDPGVRPGDDFFRYANGHWLDTHAIPGDRQEYGLRAQMTERIEARLHALLEKAGEAAPDTLEGKAGAFYRSFMDERRIEALGTQPLQPGLARIRRAGGRDALAGLMGRSTTDLVGSLFQVGTDIDLKEPGVYRVYLSQSGLGLPDRGYYLDPAFAKEKAAYAAYVVRLLRLLDWPEAAVRAREVVAFETAIAEASWTKVQQRDPVAMYNPVTLAELKTLAPGFDWTAFLAQAGLAKAPRLAVGERSAFPKLAALYAHTPLATIRAWHAFHHADQAAPYLSKAFVDAYFELHEKTLSGQLQPKPRWLRALAAVSGGDFGSDTDRFGTFGTLGFGVGQLYAQRYFTPEAKALIETMVTSIKAAFRTRIEHLDWMEPATRKAALDKLDTYVIKVGYPDHPRDYSALTLDPKDLLGNVRRAAAADWAFTTGRLPGPVDKSDWLMTPQTNDAYNGSLRDIAFPAGILQAPFFDPAADPALNFGGIGVVIGHELTHGFDDQGRKVGAAGALRDWWTPADAAQFEARAQRLGAQYSAYEPVKGCHVNGDLTMGENIADLGGVVIALDAYRSFLQGRPAPVLDGLTGEQRFFLGWAQARCTQWTDDATRQRCVSDPHSPNAFRVMGTDRNVDAWYEAFGVKPGDRMYLPPEARVRIW